MSAVVLTILGDNTGARRAIAETRSDYSRTVDGMGVAARRAAAERRRIEADEIAETRRVLRAQHQERVRALRDRQRAEEAAAKQRARAAQAEAAAQAKAEKDKTRATERESKLRAQLATREAVEKARQTRREAAETARAEREKTREAEREEKRRTRLAEEEARKRVRAQARLERTTARDRRERFGRAGETVVAGARAAGQFVGDVHAQIQDARERRAQLQENVMGTVRQVGVTNVGDVNRYVAMIRERAIAEGLRSEDIATAIGQAQTEFSTLGGMQGADRATQDRVFRGAIDTAVRGANLGMDMGEFSRTRGMLQARRLTDADQQDILSFFVAASERGAVEGGSVTRESMSAIQQRMSAASARLGPNATAADRSAAERVAFRQAFAEIQVLKSAGESARLSGNAMANFERVLGNTGTQEKIRGNLQHIQDRDQRARAMKAVFDERGNFRAEMRNPLMFTGALMNAGLTNPQDLANVFGGTGAGNPMSLQANIRRMQMGLSARDAEGKTGLQRVAELTRSDVAISPAQEAARRDMRRQTERSELNRNQEQHDDALTQNTNELTKLSNAFANWSARNPLGSSALGAGGSLLGSLVTGSVVGKAMSRVPGLPGAGSGGVVGAISRKLAPAAAAITGGSAAIAGLATLSTASMANAGRTAVTGRDLGGQEVGGLRRVLSGSMLGALATGESGTQIGEMIARAITRELRASPLTARVDTPTAQFLASAPRSTP